MGAVERQAYAAAILADRMDEGAVDLAPIYDDLESFSCEPYRGRVDLVSAGFPCQGASVAGKRLGIEDERWLWREVWRITLAIEAPWLFIENVTGLLSVNGGRAFEEVIGDLGARGWAAEWDCVPAGAVGAPHLRDRLFLLAANPDRVAVRVEPERNQRRGRGERAPQRGQAEPRVGGEERAASDPDRDGSSVGTKRSRRRSRGRDEVYKTGVRGSKITDADHESEPSPDRSRSAGEGGRRADDAPHGSSEASDTDRDRQQAAGERGRGEPQTGPAADARGSDRTADAHPANASRERRHEGLSLDPGARWQGGADATGGDQSAPRAWHAADANDTGLESEWHGGEPLGVDGEQAHGRDADGRGGPRLGDLDGILAAGRAHWDWSLAPEPCVRGLDDGPADGMGDDPAYADKLHLLGNGVVPYQAAVAFAILWDRLHGTALDVGDER